MCNTIKLRIRDSRGRHGKMREETEVDRVFVCNGGEKVCGRIIREAPNGIWFII